MTGAQRAEDCVECRTTEQLPTAAAGPSKIDSDVPHASQAAQGTAAPSDAAAPSTTTEITPPTRRLPAITIEYCDRCRWAPRASWIQTELFLTFPPPHVAQITLIPLNAPETGGRFRVWLDLGHGDELMWDRKSEGGFPELKVLKQRIRDKVQPDRGLGHSDAHPKHVSQEESA